MLSRAVTALGITQIVGWGSTYYSSAVLFAPMAEDTGWSITLVFGAFSWAMLLSGLVSRRVGELAEQHGERRVMTAGMGRPGGALHGLIRGDPVGCDYGAGHGSPQFPDDVLLGDDPEPVGLFHQHRRVAAAQLLGDLVQVRIGLHHG